MVACGPKTAHVQARVEPPPALVVPTPPPRVIVPPQPEPPAQVEDTQPPSPARSRPQRAAAPRQEAKPEAKPESAPAEATTPETAPPAPEKPPTPADAAGVAAVRQQMGRATQNLTQVNYPGLSNDMKTQYDTANRFLALAEQALKEGNLLFASTLADKAGAIAALLTGH